MLLWFLKANTRMYALLSAITMFIQQLHSSQDITRVDYEGFFCLANVIAKCPRLIAFGGSFNKQRFGPFFPCFLWSNVRVPMGIITSSPLHNHSYQAELDFPFRRTLNTKFINKYIMEVVKNKDFFSKSFLEIMDEL